MGVIGRTEEWAGCSTNPFPPEDQLVHQCMVKKASGCSYAVKSPVSNKEGEIGYQEGKKNVAFKRSFLLDVSKSGIGMA